MSSDWNVEKCQALIDQARADRLVSERDGDLGTTLFIDGFIAGAIEARYALTNSFMMGDNGRPYPGWLDD